MITKLFIAAISVVVLCIVCIVMITIIECGKEVVRNHKYSAIVCEFDLRKQEFKSSNARTRYARAASWAMMRNGFQPHDSLEDIAALSIVLKNKLFPEIPMAYIVKVDIPVLYKDPAYKRIMTKYDRKYKSFGNDRKIAIDIMTRYCNALQKESKLQAFDCEQIYKLSDSDIYIYLHGTLASMISEKDMSAKLSLI